MRTRTHAIVVLAALAVAAASCGGSEPAPPPPAAPAALAVASVDLGSAIDAERRVVEPKTAFAPTDTIYASVATTGAGTAKLTARWTFEDGQVVNESTQDVAPTGPATHEFHVTKDTPWPAGGYRVEILLNGAPVMTKEFTVGG
jgi:hypothetical protein